MFPYTTHDFIFLLAAVAAVLGMISVVSGILLLLTRSSGSAVQTLANQTARLAQKGIAEEIAGLVGNASSLMGALNELTRTSAGVGIFLLLFGFLMMAAAFGMVRFY